MARDDVFVKYYITGLAYVRCDVLTVRDGFFTIELNHITREKFIQCDVFLSLPLGLASMSVLLSTDVCY